RPSSQWLLPARLVLRTERVCGLAERTPMDREAATEALSLIALLIGEIMEDDVDSALTVPVLQGSDWSLRLTLAGEDIAVLGRALAVIARRAGEIDSAV